MAALTSTNVRTIKAWTEGSVTGKLRTVRRVEVHGGAWGGVTNTLPATAFGLTVVEEVTPLLYGANNEAYALVPSQDGTLVYVMDGVGAGSAPADVTLAATTSGGYFTVKGY